MKRSTLIPWWVRIALLFRRAKTAPPEYEGPFMTITHYKVYRNTTYILKVEHWTKRGRKLAKTKDSRYTPEGQL